MIAHVAEAHEARGRVILRIVHSADRRAIEAAARIAQAYQAEIETLFVEDDDLFACAEFPFSMEISPSARVRRPFRAHDIERDYRSLRRTASLAVAAVAEPLSVPVVSKAARDDQIRATAVACAIKGPWNVIVCAEPVLRHDYAKLGELFSAVNDATGVVLVGGKDARANGPVVALVDRINDLTGTIRTAQRLARATDDPVVLMMAGPTEDAVAQLEAETRLVLANWEDEVADVRIATSHRLYADPAAVLYAIERLAPGFIVARFGGPLAMDPTSLGVLQEHLCCPILVGRGSRD